MSDKKVTLFEKSLRLSSDGIRGKRAEFATEDAMAAQNELITAIEKRKRDTERRLVKLQDIHRESEVSLMVTRDNTDEMYWENWVQKIQDAKVQLANIEVELKLANQTKKNWFTANESL